VKYLEPLFLNYIGIVLKDVDQALLDTQAANGVSIEAIGR
jgi:hypothetical protein